MPLPSCLVEAPRHERTVHGWVDAPGEETLRITVRVADPWVGVELEAETTPAPAYAIREARGRVLVGSAARVDPALAPAMAGLAGLPMTAGYTRAVARVAAARPGAAYFLAAATEMARLARQVTRLPPAVVERYWADGPIGAWRLDVLGWTDLPGSCYAYRPETERLFAERPVSSPAPVTLYGPPPGAARVFNRTRVLRLERRPDGLALGHAMVDEVHSFQLWCLVDPQTGTVREAALLTPRLPYAGICSDPQARVRGLVGERVDAGLPGRLGPLLGGPDGCAQLYDLAADLLRLLASP